MGDPSNVNRETDVLLWATSEVARQLQVSPRTVYRLVAEGVLPSVKIGRSIRVPKEAVLDWVQVGTDI